MTDIYIADHNAIFYPKILFAVNSQNNFIKTIKNFVENNPLEKILIDSGAFFSFYKGHSLDINFVIEKFLEIKSFLKCELYFFNLDIFGDIDKTINNYLYFLKNSTIKKEELIFVVRGESTDKELFKQIDFINEINIPYIAIGGVARRQTKKTKQILDNVFFKLNKKLKNNVKIHLLGKLTLELLLLYPFESCDRKFFIKSLLMSEYSISLNNKRNKTGIKLFLKNKNLLMKRLNKIKKTEVFIKYYWRKNYEMAKNKYRKTLPSWLEL